MCIAEHDQRRSRIASSRGSRLGQRAATLVLLIGNACAFQGVYAYIATGNSLAISVVSPFKGAHFTFQADPLSLVFLIPILLMSTLGSIYGLSYWRRISIPLIAGSYRCFGER